MNYRSQKKGEYLSSSVCGEVADGCSVQQRERERVCCSPHARVSLKQVYSDPATRNDCPVQVTISELLPEQLELLFGEVNYPKFNRQK